MKQVKSGLKIALILALLLLVTGVQAVSYDPGWTIAHYKNQVWSGMPVVTNDQPHIRFATPYAFTYYGYSSAIPQWPSGIIGQYQDFSITCEGYVDIPAAGDYAFYTTSDDGVMLVVNGITVIDNPSDHGPTVDKAIVSLPAGYQHVVLKYRENSDGGDPTIENPGNIGVIYLEYESGTMARTSVPGYHVSTIPSPEFPTAFVPVALIAGLVGAVVLIRRTREN